MDLKPDPVTETVDEPFRTGFKPGLGLPFSLSLASFMSGCDIGEFSLNC